MSVSTSNGHGGLLGWCTACYEAEFDVPAGKSRIEIAVKSPAEGFEEPVVLNDWRVKR